MKSVQNSNKYKKIVIAGDGGVGKTTLVSTRVRGEFNFSTDITIGVDFAIVKFSKSNLPDLLVFDLGGQERFQFIHDSFMKGSSGCVLLYDATREKSFQGLIKWLKLIKNTCGKIPVVVGGTKRDLCQEEDIHYYKNKWDSFYCSELQGSFPQIVAHKLISSKEYLGVDEVFEILAKNLELSSKELKTWVS